MLLEKEKKRIKSLIIKIEMKQTFEFFGTNKSQDVVVLYPFSFMLSDAYTSYRCFIYGDY